MQVVVQGILTEYHRVGKGKPVLILHGWGDAGASWQSFSKKLGAHYDVITPDLPGFGGTETPKAPWTLTKYAEFVRDFLQKIDVKPYMIIGHSNGGAIAIRTVGRGFVQTEKLALLASAGVRGTKNRRTLYVMTKVGKAVAAPLPKRVKKQLRSKLYKKVGSDLLVAEHMQETFKHIVRDDVRADAAYISTPTLLVYGEQDAETPIKLGQELQNAIEGSRFLALTGKGHMLHIEAEEELLSAIRDFVRA